jgi:hypothetical protein
LNLQDETLGSDDTYPEIVADEWTPTNVFLHNLQKTKPEGEFILWGIFEYCDIFGRHHCDDFSYRYTPTTGRWQSQTPLLMCSQALRKDKPPKPAIIMGKSYPWTELPRCEQYNEKEFSEQ